MSSLPLVYFLPFGTFTGSALICAIKSARFAPSCTVSPMSIANCSKSSIFNSSSCVASRCPIGDPSAFLPVSTVIPPALLSAALFPAASSFSSHSGTFAPISAAFSAMLPNSVKMYHTSTTGKIRLEYVSPIPAGFQPLPKRDRIPRVGQIACGTPILAEENVEAYDEVPSDWHADFTLLCQGDSMEPKIKDGDVVAIHSQPMVENGEVAAVLIDGEATLKRVFLFDDHIELRAENPTFPTILRIGEDMNTITIEGKAVGLCRKL